MTDKDIYASQSRIICPHCGANWHPSIDYVIDVANEWVTQNCIGCGGPFEVRKAVEIHWESRKEQK